MIEIKQKYDSQLLKKSKHNGPLKYKNGDVYIGNIKNGKPEGEGVIKYKNGSMYMGDWKNGERDGEGTMRYISGEIYIGEWKNGKRHGKGQSYFKCSHLDLKRKNITKEEKKSKRRKNE